MDLGSRISHSGQHFGIWHRAFGIEHLAEGGGGGEGEGEGEGERIGGKIPRQLSLSLSCVIVAMRCHVVLFGNT